MGKETLSEPREATSKQEPPKEEIQSLDDKVKNLKKKSAEEFESDLSEARVDVEDVEGKVNTE